MDDETSKAGVAIAEAALAHLAKVLELAQRSDLLELEAGPPELAIGEERVELRWPELLLAVLRSGEVIAYEASGLVTAYAADGRELSRFHDVLGDPALN